MKNYSIVRVGHEYVVQAGEKSILKVASRRRAAQLIVVAAELLDAPRCPRLPPLACAAASIDRDPYGMADPSEVP